MHVQCKRLLYTAGLAPAGQVTISSTGQGRPLVWPGGIPANTGQVGFNMGQGGVHDSIGQSRHKGGVVWEITLWATGGRFDLLTGGSCVDSCLKLPLAGRESPDAARHFMLIKLYSLCQFHLGFITPLPDIN